MRNRVWMMGALTAALLATACDRCNETPPPSSEPVVVPGELFAFDTVTHEVSYSLDGGKGARLVGRLSGARGQRAVVYISDDGAAEEVFEADWTVASVGAASSSGAAVVCVNRLDGPRRDDALPDPRDGVWVRCRHRSADGIWGPTVILVEGSGAWWLVEVRVTDPAGFEVVWSRDASGAFEPELEPGDGLFHAAFGPEGFGTVAEEVR